MANIIIVSGPQAVGKMTVAEKIKELTGYSLMVNHDSIEVSDKIFGYATTPQKEFNKLIREAAFNTAIKYNIDMIFTFVTAFDQESDLEYLNGLKKMFEKTGGKFYFVELSADVEERLKRNITPHRLASKFTKNDIERSKNDLLKTMEKYRLNSNDGEYICENHLKIDNTYLEPEQVAKQVVEFFGLEPVDNDKKTR
jgi:cytidylate kinase